MLGRVSAAAVVREATSGRTRPLIMSCDSGADENIEVFCKVSDGCEEGILGLAREVVAACIADCLDLPVPDPWLVDLPAALPNALQDVSIARRIRDSSNVAFGSTFLRRPFSVWPQGKRISRSMLPVALGAFVFDAVIENVDRRTSNPNCLVAGEEIRLIDHELAELGRESGVTVGVGRNAMAEGSRSAHLLRGVEKTSSSPRLRPFAQIVVSLNRQTLGSDSSAHTA